MKKLLLLATAVVLSAFGCAYAQGVRVYRSNGTTQMFRAEEVDSVIFFEKETGKEEYIRTPAEQKQYLEKTALELMDMMPSSDFDRLGELSAYFNDTYADYDWSRVETWAEDILDNAKDATGMTGHTTEVDSFVDAWSGRTYRYFLDTYYTNYKSLLVASNFVGHFTAKNGKWVWTWADDLQFIFKDKNGEQCVLAVVTEGDVKKVHAADLDSYVKSESSYEDAGNSENMYHKEYYDRNAYTLGVPEKVTVTLTQGDTKLAEATVNVDLKSLSGEEFDFSKDAITASCATNFYNGYTAEVRNAAYSGNSSAAASFVLSKGSKALVSMGCAASLSDIPAINASSVTRDDFDMDNYDVDNTTAKNVFVSVDILGKVQITGTVSDVRKYVDYANKAQDNDTDERTFKSYVSQANGLTDIYMFFDGTATKQAKVVAEGFCGESWDGKECWEAEPVLTFFDGSSYSTFGAFFSETDFKKTTDVFEDLLDKYIDLFGIDSGEDDAVAPSENQTVNGRIVNGHRFVDLGLPSGLLWAETNIGAETAADSGDHFAWGETAAKGYYDWSTYSWGTSKSSISKYCYEDDLRSLEQPDDAAYANWGSSCRMPTVSEFYELNNSDNCTWTWTSKTASDGSAVNGYEVKSNKNGNSIFLPASGYRDDDGRYQYGSAGCYWSSMLYTNDESKAFNLYFSSGYISSNDWDQRYVGRSARPVAEP